MTGILSKHLQSIGDRRTHNMSTEQPIPIMMSTPSSSVHAATQMSKPEPDWLHRFNSPDRFTMLSLKTTPQGSNERAGEWCEAEISKALQEMGSITCLSLCGEAAEETHANPLRDSEYVDDEDCWMVLDAEPQVVVDEVKTKTSNQQRRRRPSLPDIQSDALMAVGAVSSHVNLEKLPPLFIAKAQRRRRPSLPDVQPAALIAVAAVSVDANLVEEEPVVVSTKTRRRRRPSLPDIHPDALIAVEAVSAVVGLVKEVPVVLSTKPHRRRRPSLPDIHPDALIAVAAESVDVNLAEKEPVVVLRTTTNRRRRPTLLLSLLKEEVLVKSTTSHRKASRISHRKRRPSLPDIQPDALIAVEALEVDGSAKRPAALLLDNMEAFFSSEDASDSIPVFKRATSGLSAIAA